MPEVATIASLRSNDPVSTNYLPALDGVRGLAILAVLIFHFSQGMHGLQFPRPVEQVLRLLTLGQKGVDLFFVLSGFLITGILLRTKGSPGYLLTFYLRRALRIFPLYFAVVFACLLCGWIWSMPNYAFGKSWWYLLYLQNVAGTFWPGTVSGPGHFWSLAVEEHFYLFWPFVVMALARRSLAVFAIALIFAAGLFRVLLLSAGYDVFTFTFCRMDALALGALLAVSFRETRSWTAVSNWTKRVFWPVFALGLPAFFMLSGSANPVQQAFKYAIFAVFSGGLVVLALDTNPEAFLPRIFRASSLRFIGKISYAMYVFHPWICGWLWRIGARPSWSPLRGHELLANLVDFGLVLATTVLVAWLSWILFESRILKLKGRFEYHTDWRTNHDRKPQTIVVGAHCPAE